MQTKMQALFLSCLAVCAAFTVLASAQRVDTDPSAITVVENQENVTLHCRVGSPAKLCLINLPGLSQQIQLDANEPSPVPGIQYHGEGVERGSCGVRIARITADNAGIMNCTLFVNGIGQTGSIDITVAFPPEQPTINVVSDGDIGNLVVDSTLTFECTAARGNPAANISWLLDNEPIYEQVHPQKPEEQFDESSNKRYFTAQSILVRTIRAEDNGKRLTCQAQHMAYPQGVSNTDLVLNVNFQPQALQDQVIYGLQVGRTSVATVTIISNPPPTIFWNIDGIDYHQGTENGRFAVPIPEPLGNNRYNVSLTIAGLTLEDLSRTYTLRASNAFGSEDYRVFLRSQGDATINESSSIGIGEIVGLVLAVLIVLTAIALIFVARATGRWCFRGAGSSTSTSAAKIGETSDTESAEVKNPMTKAQRFKNIFAKGLQRGTQAGSDLPEPVAPIPDVVVDEQDASKKQQQQQQSGDAETLAGGNTKPVKDDQTLVYAELELKPSEISFVNKPASNESTEYAEILYVQQQQKQQQEQQQQQQQQQQQPGGAAEVGIESRTVPRSHSGDDNRPVIDVSLNKPSHKNTDKGTAAGGK